jgi:hypothetical protein
MAVMSEIGGKAEVDPRCRQFASVPRAVIGVAAMCVCFSAEYSNFVLRIEAPSGALKPLRTLMDLIAT